MKTRESLLTDCKNQTRKIVVKFYLWENLRLLAAGKFFRGSEKKRGKARRKIIVLTP